MCPCDTQTTMRYSAMNIDQQGFVGLAYVGLPVGRCASCPGKRWGAACFGVLAALLLGAGGAWCAPLPRAQEQPQVLLPDIAAEVRTFDAPEKTPVPWWPHVVNAAWGRGYGAPERNGGWIDRNWQLVDYIDRSGDYSTHDYLAHRGIWYEIYGNNEYQESIHFVEEGARKLLWDNGIARDPSGQRVLSADYNMKVAWWAKQIGWEAFITCNNAPRWSSIIDYDWLTSPLLGFAISQDNIGGPLGRIGAGDHGRYCDFCNAKFFDYLARNNRLPEFRRQYKHIRDYVQANLADVMRQLPPQVKHRYNAAEGALVAQMCAPPVMSEYQKFLYLSHLDNFLHYYQDAKLVASRIGRPYDVHGNQGGSFIGTDPYQVALADFVDMVWFESAGISTYDMFQHHWCNCGGSMRYQMGQAMTRGRKPFLSMTGFPKHAPDLVEHEMAEQCAGGGALFVDQNAFLKEPALQEKVTSYFRFRHTHRGVFSLAGRRPYSKVALVYSIPTLMYRSYQYTADAPPVNDLFGIARAMEEGHVPFDIVILNHPEIHADRVTLEELKRYDLVVLPAVECLSDAQVALVQQYHEAGGVLGLLGTSGVRDENNVPRAAPPALLQGSAAWVIDLLPGKHFRPLRAGDGPATRALTDVAVENMRQGLGEKAVIGKDLPRMLWLKTWTHGDEFLSVHLVNYDVSFDSGTAKPTGPLNLVVTLPQGVPAEEALWLTADGKSETVAMTLSGTQATIAIPPVRVYGVLLIGRKGLDRTRSAVLLGDALRARAKMASKGQWGAFSDKAAALDVAAAQCAAGSCPVEAAEAYCRLAQELLEACCKTEDQSFQSRVRQSVAVEKPVLSLAFGAKQVEAPWRSVAVESVYRAELGYGWLPGDDTSEPTPEETYYYHVNKEAASELLATGVPFWPYRPAAPLPVRNAISCGTPRKFRVDLPPGSYMVRAMTANPCYTNRNFLVSGMVAVDGEVRLLDEPHERGAVMAREFPVVAKNGKLEFCFGGPTGWSLAAMIIRPADRVEADPQVSGGLRTWQVSPRYPNPQWYPITQVQYTPEQRIGSLPDPGWTVVAAPPGGLPVVDLGDNRQGEVGDVVYATTSIDRAAAGEAWLHFSASSQAQLWLNGSQLGRVPNEKGVRRDEYVVRVPLRQGRNLLVVKLQRFWERHWMFCASLTEGKNGR